MDAETLLNPDTGLAVVGAVMVLPIIAHALYIVGKRESAGLMTALMLAAALGWMYAVLALPASGTYEVLPAAWLLPFIVPVAILMALGLWRIAGRALPSRPLALRLPVAALFLVFGVLFSLGHLSAGAAAAF